MIIFKQLLVTTLCTPIALVLASHMLCAQQREQEIVLQEDFKDISLPPWHGARPDAVKFRVKMPDDLQDATVSIGLQACTDKARWASLTVSVDGRFPNQQALERFLAREQREAYAKLDPSTLSVKCLEGGIVQVFTGDRYVPRKYWNEAVRQAVLAKTSRSKSLQQRSEGRFGKPLSRALQRRAEELQAGMSGVQGSGLNDRAYEIASLHERVRQIETGTAAREEVVLNVDGTSALAVSPLVFGNNINAQNLSAPYDSERSKFDDEFLQRVRPMRIAFLRYPGGCNADVFVIHTGFAISTSFRI